MTATTLQHCAAKRRAARTVRIVLLGFGTVGSAVARLLASDGQRIRDRTGLDLHIGRILVRDAQRPRDRHGIDAALFTDDPGLAIETPADIVVEALGGLEPASSLIAEALEQGTAVVSANKSAIAANAERFRRLARRSGAGLRYDAALCAGVPVLAMTDQLAGDRVLDVQGIVNGTCNFLLTHMTRTGATLDAALRDAVERGLAEPNPSADLSGRDSAEKLCILTHALGIGDIQPDHVRTRGIEDITPSDLLWAARAARTGYVLKLLARIANDSAGVRLHVEPTFVSRNHLLAQVDGAENALIIRTALRGDLLIRGMGAGPEPTVAALLADILRAASTPHPRNEPPRHSFTSVPLGSSVCHGSDDPKGESPRFYIRAPGSARGIMPDRLAGAFRGAGVPLARIECNGMANRVLTQRIDRRRAIVAIESLGADVLDQTLICPLLE